MSEEEMKVMLDDACPCKDGKLDYSEVLTAWGMIYMYMVYLVS